MTPHDTDADLTYWALVRYANQLETGDPMISIQDVKEQLKNPKLLTGGRSQWLRQAEAHHRRLGVLTLTVIHRLHQLASQQEAQQLSPQLVELSS